MKEFILLRYNLSNYFLSIFLRSLPSFELANTGFIPSFPKGARLFLDARYKRVLEFKLIHTFPPAPQIKGPAVCPTLK